MNAGDSFTNANRMESAEEGCSPVPVAGTVSSDDGESDDTDNSNEHLKDNLELTPAVKETATEHNSEKMKLEGQFFELDSIIKELDTIQNNDEIEENVVSEENEEEENRHDSEHQIEGSQDILDHNKRFFDG